MTALGGFSMSYQNRTLSMFLACTYYYVTQQTLTDTHSRSHPAPVIVSDSAPMGMRGGGVPQSISDYRGDWLSPDQQPPAHHPKIAKVFQRGSRDLIKSAVAEATGPERVPTQWERIQALALITQALRVSCPTEIHWEGQGAMLDGVWVSIWALKGKIIYRVHLLENTSTAPINVVLKFSGFVRSASMSCI